MVYQNNRTWNKIKNGPYMVWGIIGITVLVYLGMTLDGFSKGMGFSGSSSVVILTDFGALNRERIIFGHEYWRFISPIFVHIGLSHIVVNMVTLYFLGRQLEAVLGHSRFLILYLLTGLSGNLLSFAFGNPAAISAGASTSLFGLFGVAVALGRVYQHPAVSALGRNMFALIVMNLLFALPSNLLGENIDLLGHLGGVLGGFPLGFVVKCPPLEGGRYDVKERSVHQRIIGTVVYIFLVVLCIAYGIKRFSFG